MTEYIGLLLLKQIRFCIRKALTMKKLETTRVQRKVVSQEKLHSLNMIHSIIYFLLTVLIAVLVWWLYFTSTRFYKLCVKIPGPKPLPVIGNIELLRSRRMFLKNFMNVFREHSPVFKVFLGNMCIVGLRDPDDIHKLLQSTEAISKFKNFSSVTLVLGENLFTAQRKNWKRYRRMWNPAFKSQVIRNLIPIFNKNCQILIKLLKLKNGIFKFDIRDTVLSLTMDMILESVSGVNFKILEKENTEILLVVEKSKELIQEIALLPIYWFKMVFRHSKYYKYVSHLLRTSRQLLEPIIKKYSNAPVNRKDSKSIDLEKKNEWKMFDYVLHFINKNGKFTEDEIMNHIRMVAFAGSETTAFTLSVCFMLLGLYKDVQNKILKELQDIFGADINRPVTYDDLQRMEYTEQVIKETLRLFTVAYLTGRRVEEDIQIGEYILPAGTDVVISPFLLHRDPKYFPEPLKFDPERFTPENIRARNYHCFIPFFSGPRNCIGHYYAMIQMKTVLSTILRHFEFLPCGNREQMEDLDMQMVLSLKQGYKVCMKIRNTEYVNEY